MVSSLEFRVGEQRLILLARGRADVRTSTLPSHSANDKIISRCGLASGEFLPNCLVSVRARALASHKAIVPQVEKTGPTEESVEHKSDPRLQGRSFGLLLSRTGDS